METEVERIKQDIFLKYLSEWSWKRFGMSTAKMILDTVIGLTSADTLYSLATAIKDIITSGKQVSETSKYQWSDFCPGIQTDFI